jgi:diguanylate cyclase (GGDEF)-like protein
MRSPVNVEPGQSPPSGEGHCLTTRSGRRIGGAVAATFGVLLTGLTLFACLFCEFLRSRDARRAEEACTIEAGRLVAPQAAALLLRPTDDALRQWARSLRANPGVRLVALYDRQGCLRALEAATPWWARQARTPGNLKGGSSAPIACRMADPDGAEAHVADVPIALRAGEPPIGQLTIAIAAGDRPPCGISQRLSVYLPLIAAAALVWWFGRRLILQRVVELLGEISRRSLKAACPEPAGGEDPVVSFAEYVEALNAEINHWRDKARNLELTLEKKVESQTKGYLAQLRRAMREAEIDPLTGLYNRRAIDLHLDQLVAEHVQQGSSLTFVMIDLDHFKRFNDTLGHPAGDELLVFVGRLLKNTVREDDLAVRYGGDEFLLIFSSTTADQAAEITRRLVALLGQHVRTLPPVRPPLSLSAGIASLRRGETATARELLVTADEALYQAKAKGGAGLAVAHAVA